MGAAKKEGAGRPGGYHLARLILAILGGLSEDGDMVNVHAIARRFSNSDEFAQRLVESIKVLPAGDEFFLPLYYRDGDPDLALMEGGVRGKRLRLTRDETIALLAAFDRIGIQEGNSLRKALEASMLAADVDADETQRIDAPSPVRDTALLERCVAAICSGRRIRISYQGRLDDAPRQRLIDPTGIRQSDGVWYVDAFDAHSGKRRSFRHDRMFSVEEAGLAARHGEEAAQEERPVIVHFSDPSVLQTLWIPRMEVLEQDESGISARIPYYGGNWLAQRLAACGSSVTTDDEELSALIRRVARDALERLA